MEETTFKIEWQELARCYLISRYHPLSGQWIIQDTRVFRRSAVRFSRKRAAKKGRAYLVLTKIYGDGTMELTYRRP